MWIPVMPNRARDRIRSGDLNTGATSPVPPRYRVPSTATFVLRSSHTIQSHNQTDSGVMPKRLQLQVLSAEQEDKQPTHTKSISPWRGGLHTGLDDTMGLCKDVVVLNRSRELTFTTWPVQHNFLSPPLQNKTSGSTRPLIRGEPRLSNRRPLLALIWRPPFRQVNSKAAPRLIRRDLARY